MQDEKTKNLSQLMLGQVINSCGATQFDGKPSSHSVPTYGTLFNGSVNRRLLLAPCAFGRPHKSIHSSD